MVKLVTLDHKERLVYQDLSALQDLLDLLVVQVSKAAEASGDQEDPQDLLVKWESKAHKDKEERLARQDHRDQGVSLAQVESLDHRAQEDELVSKDHKVREEILVHRVLKAHRDQEVALVNKVKWVALAPQVNKEYRVRLGLLDPEEKEDNQAHKDQWAQLDQLAH